MSSSPRSPNTRVWSLAAASVLSVLLACQPSPLEQAEAAMAAQDYATAAALYEPLYQRGQDVAEPYARALARSGRVTDAEAVVVGIPGAAGDLEFQILKIRGDLLRGDITHALPAAQALAAAHPDVVDVTVVLGDALAQAGQLQAAARTYRLALAVDASQARAAIGLGDIAFASMDLAGAEADYRQAMEMGGTSAAGVQARTRLARLLTALGRQAEAADLISEAMSLQPDHPAAVAEFGKLLVRSGYLAEALGPLQDAQRSLGEDAELQSFLGFVYLQRARRQAVATEQIKDLQAAKMWLTRASSRDATRVDALNNLGQVQLMLGDLEGAEAAFRKAWEASPSQVESLMSLARLYADQGQLERAASVLQTALQTSPGNVVVQMNLGVLALREGKNDEASRWLAEAGASCENTAPDHPCRAELAFNMARLLGRQGDVKGGVDQLDRALTLGYSDLGRLLAEPDLEAIRADIRIANSIDGLRMRNWN